MSQTGYIAAFLIIGFVVFITLRGELNQYLAVAGIGVPAGSTVPGSNLYAQSNSATAGLSTTTELPNLPSL